MSVHTTMHSATHRVCGRVILLADRRHQTLAQCRTTGGASFSVSRSFQYLLARLAPFALEAVPPPAVTHLAIKDSVAFQADRVLDSWESRRV
jgi:hypothetical protein